MNNFNFADTRAYLHDFKFKALFIEVLGWASPRNIQPVAADIDGLRISATPIAHLAGIAVFEVTTSTGEIPGLKARKEFHGEVAKQYHENVLIFVDKARTQSIWYWVKWDNRRPIAREHLYMRGQPGDLFLGKISAMYVDISELDASGDINVIQVVQRLQKALDVERVTKKFYNEYAEERIQFTELIQGIDNEHDRRWYASVLLNRLMFIFFLQRKGFVDNGDLEYLQRKLAASKNRGADQYYEYFLKLLFFEGFAKPEENRSAEARQMLGKIRYLNGGLFLKHSVEVRYPNIVIPDAAFENLLKLFSSYSWNLNDTPGGQDNEINPDVLGYIFEKYINQKAFGAYYTRTEITEYLCEQTIYRLVLNAVNTEGVPGVVFPRHFDNVPELLMNLDARLCRQLLFEVLPKLSLLDPACGSGAFLVAAMKTLIDIYSGIMGRIEVVNDPSLREWASKVRGEHPSLLYYIKRTIITKNLFGVDIMEEATEIARLRLFLALVASADKVEQLEPLPNIDFNILSGNSLIGLLRVDEKAFDSRYKQVSLFQKSYHQLVEEKRRNLEIFRNTSQYTEDLQFMRDEIQTQRQEAYEGLNDLLLNEFSRLGIKYEEATWDPKQNKEGKPKKRAVQHKDILDLMPFHWGYEFDEVMNERGGFDAIITNPPWEIIKPNAKEFFADYSDLVSKKKMTIKDFEQAQDELLKQPDIRAAWLEYLSRFPHVGAYYREAPQFVNQISYLNGKKAGSDTNLYKLFVEQCYNLLRSGGECGIIIPTGIYTDLGTKQLREVLFSQTSITGILSLANERFIFENVDHRFKFCLLTFEKRGHTDSFEAVFRINPREAVSAEELSSFLNDHECRVKISVPLMRRLSPDSLSIMEFRNETDARVAEKMLVYPLLGDDIAGAWKLKLYREFDMTNDSHLFHMKPGSGLLPLYEGKMISHFTHHLAEPRFWIDEREARKALTGKATDTGTKLDYQDYRLGIRAVASSTNERSMIASVIPANVFCGNSLLVSKKGFNHPKEMLFLTGILDSYVIDWLLKQKVSQNINMFYIYQLPVPRLTEGVPSIEPIVNRVARLICTTTEFDELAQAVGLTSYHDGIAEVGERSKIRAELDGMIARLYNLTEEEFAHILSAFPLVSDQAKQDALEAFRKLSPDLELTALISNGENDRVEFKAAAFHYPKNPKTDGKDEKENIKQAVAAFMNTAGGTLLIGVEDNGDIIGIEQEYASANPMKKNWDGYYLKLADVLKDGLSLPNAHQYYQVTAHPIAGKVICKIEVKPTPEPVFVDKVIYIRANSRHLPVHASLTYKYIKEHWG